MSAGSGPKITLARKSGALALAKRVAGLTKLAAYVGIPASDARTRSTQLLAMAGKLKSGSKKRAWLEKASTEDVNKGTAVHLQQGQICKTWAVASGRFVFAHQGLADAEPKTAPGVRAGRGS